MIKLQIILIAVMLFSSCCKADVLVTQSNQKHYGLAIGPTADSIQFLELNPDTNEFETRDFDRQIVKSITVTIDQDKLNNLDFDNLYSIREYAEELASIENDASCNRLAKRIFLLLIYRCGPLNEHQSLVESSCRNLAKLANSNKELILFEKIGVVYAGLKFSTQLENNAAPAAYPDDELLELLRMLRNEQLEAAHKRLNKLRDANQVPSEIEEIAVPILATRNVDDAALHRIVTMEIHLLVPQSQSATKLDPRQFLNRESSKPVGLIKLEDIVEFDLQATQFENGRWIRPQKDNTAHKKSPK